jgi:hypothetical protein
MLPRGSGWAVLGKAEMDAPKVGERVYYEDMANPRQDGVVVELKTTVWGTQYAVQFDDGEITYSDLRQHGWKRV